MPRRRMRLICVSLLLGLGLCCALCWGQRQLETGTQLCADTLRLHIRADSDAVCDQSAKLMVRDAVLQLMQRCPAGDEAAARSWAAQHLIQFQLTAQHTLAQLGIRTPVRVWLVNMYFDTTAYSDASLPAGRYDAVRIDIGSDSRYGRNWWCVLYPGLCRPACTSYDLPRENDLICGDYILRFCLVEWWNRHTASREDILLAGA